MKEFFSVKDLSKLLNIHHKRVRRLLETNGIKTTAIGGIGYVTRAELVEKLDEFKAFFMNEDVVSLTPKNIDLLNGSSARLVLKRLAEDYHITIDTDRGMVLAVDIEPRLNQTDTQD